jgi:hypothetical protein
MILVSRRFCRLCLVCVLTYLGTTQCSPPIVESKWIHQIGNDLNVRVDTLVSPRDTSFTIGEMSGLAVGERMLYMSDNSLMRIHLFDLEGNYLRSIGKRGRGPGEFLNMSAIAWFPKRQELAVYDHMNFRLSRLDPNGNYIGSCSYTPNDIEWPRSITELDEDRHIAVFLISKDLETDGDMHLIHQIDTESCIIEQQTLSLKSLEHYQQDQTFLGVFSLFSPGQVIKSGNDILYKTAVDDGFLYNLSPGNMSLISTESFKTLFEEPPYRPATADMIQDNRVMAISGRIGAAVVIESDLVGYGSLADEKLYQFVLHRPSPDSSSLLMDILDRANQTRTRHVLVHHIPIYLGTRRGFVPAFRIMGYHNKSYFAISFYDGEQYFLRLSLSETQ